MSVKRGYAAWLLAALVCLAPLALTAAHKPQQDAAAEVEAPKDGEAGADSAKSRKASAKPSFADPDDATNAPIDATADELDMDRAKGILEGRGHVVIHRGDETLTADHVRYDMNSGEARASGNVKVTRPGAVWTGPTITYNFKTGTGEAEHIHIDAKPYRVVDSQGAYRTKDRLYHLRGGRITTCSNDYPDCHFHMRARDVEMAPGDHIKARGVTWFAGPVPFMYFPYWYHDLKNPFGYRVYPGFDSRMGGFLLNSYTIPITHDIKTTTRLDFRITRGVGVGQDLLWKPEWGEGDLSLYYANDLKPVDENDPSTADLKSDRYRIRFRQEARISDRDSVLMRAQYVSDDHLLQDFFEREYRQEAEPDNHIVYTHRGDGYTAGVTVRKRLNDFYTVVERLPELSFNVMRQEIAESSIFYEGRNAAAFLRKDFSEKDTSAKDYEAFRFDTQHMFYRPTRYFGFLNVTPRAGYRGTYYSKSLEIQNGGTLILQTNLVTRSDGKQDLVVQSVPGTNTITSEADAVFRSRLEVGAETSFKAYKTWENVNGEFRHVLEPYANYTLTTDPNVSPQDLYQFDSIDQLDKEHWLRFGARNKIQQKRAGNPFNLVDADVYTVYKISRSNGENAIENLFFDVRTVPSDDFKLRFDGRWNFDQSRFDRFNTRASYTGLKWMTANVEYRQIATQSDLLETSLDLLPRWRWSYNLYTRYEFKDSHLEEEGIWVQRNFDCLMLRMGCNYMPSFTRDDGTERKSEFRILFAFSMTAFPETNIGMRHMK